MLQVIDYCIITVMAVLLAVDMVKKRPVQELVCIAVVLVTFALRAFHIK